MTVSPALATPAWRYWMPFPPGVVVPLGQIPPDFALWDVTYQRTVRLANWRGKQPVVLFFCRLPVVETYRAERWPYLVAINRAYAQFRNAGAEVLMVANTSRRQGQAMVDDLGLTVPVLSDDTGAVFRAYRTGQAWGAPLPAQFVLDAQGRLRARHLFSLLHHQAAVESLLALVDGL